MSIQLITGASGAGKSCYIYQKIIEEAMANPHRQYLVIVPEQFTMQTQKELVKLHPGGGILNIDVLSFQRLAYRVFEEVGGDNRRLLEETGKTLVLQKVVQENRKNLKYLKNQMQRPGYIKEMKSLISELMQYDIQEDEMHRMLEDSREKALLYQKLLDVQLLYQKFRMYLQERFLTGEEVLEVLGQRIRQSEKMRKSVVVFDGFTGFTPIQYKVLEQMLMLCPQIYLTVTLGTGEKPQGKWKPFDLFAMSKRMIQSVLELAKKNGTEILPMVQITGEQGNRFVQSPALAHLERRLFRYGVHEYAKATEDIGLFSAGNPLKEMAQVSRKIVRLVREEGYRYGDIAVITGDLPSYGNYARQVFEKMEIPCFIDQKHSVLMNPFVEFIRSALDLMVQNFSYESMFRHFRCGLGRLTEEEIDRLENYVVALGIRGVARWQETWVRLYKNMPPEELLEINEIRQKAIEGLVPFAEKFKKRGNTVAEDVRALYDYIAGEAIQKQLKKQELLFAAQGNQAMEKEYAQIYGIVMNLLDKLVEILGEEKITQKEFVQLMEAGLSEATVGIIPPSTDQVLVGDIERTRLKDIKVLFFVGVNDGIIPKNSGRGGLLSENDRDFFENQGIVLAPGAREAMYMQRFYLYLNLTKPSRRLYLSHSLASAAGEALCPAYLMGVIQKLFPQITVEETHLTENEIRQFERPQEGLDSLVEGIRSVSSLPVSEDWKELYNWFARQPEYGDFLRKLAEAAFYRKPQDRLSRSVAKALYGEVSVHSATRLERFSACAFAHFLRYGLMLSERARYEFLPMDMGNVMHNALEHFSKNVKEKRLDWRTLTDAQRQELVEESLGQVVDSYGNTILHSSARNEYMIQRVRRILNRTVWALQGQMEQGAFVPEGFEVSIGGGRIDRLDVCETEDKVYVKIIDYKTGSTTFDLLEIYHGLQLQLMVYLDGALAVERRNHPDKEVIPAGVFYYNIQDPMIKTKVQGDIRSLQAQILKELKMNGLASADLKVLQKMDPGLSSLPVAVNKDGSFSARSRVATEQQFEKLREFVDGKIQDIKGRIEEGELEIAPYELGQKNGCEYCPYQSVCGFDKKIPGFEFRRLKQFSDNEIWKSIMGEV